MKNLMVGILLVLAASAGAVTVHRSFRNGYPSGAQGVAVRQQPNAAVLTVPKMAQGGTKVVTNRVVDVLVSDTRELQVPNRRGNRNQQNNQNEDQLFHDNNCIIYWDYL